MEETFFVKDFLRFRSEHREGDTRSRRDEIHDARPFRTADDELAERTANGVHEKHEDKGQHKEHAEDHQWAAVSELMEKAGGFSVDGLSGSHDNASSGELVIDKQSHHTDNHIDGVHTKSGVVR